MKTCCIGDKSLVTRGRFLKTAKLRDEYYVPIENADAFIASVRSAGVGADLLTFVQEVPDTSPTHGFYHEWDSLAVLPVSTYEHWWDQQITFKPRNRIRKAFKNVEVRQVTFDDELVRAIGAVYDESPVRQGRRNYHYGKSFETLKREHATFLENSDFIGAYFQQHLIGFAKITHVKHYSIVMNILSMIAHRDKSPTNALIAKAVELCAARKSQFLNYSTWGKREGLNEFKEAHGFQRFEVPRYFVPLTGKGQVALKWKLHRHTADYLPGEWVRHAAALRSRWNDFRFRNSNNVAGQQPSVISVAK